MTNRFSVNNLTMQQSFFARLINTFIITLILSVLLFAVFRSHFEATAALFFAVLTTIPIVIILHRIKNKRLRKLGLKQSELKHAESCTQTFRMKDPKAVLAFFHMLLSNDHPAILRKDYIKINNTLVFTRFENLSVQLSEIMEMKRTAKARGAEKIIVFGIDFEKTNSPLENVSLYNSVETYALLKQKDLFPKIDQNAKKKRKNIFKSAFKRKNFKHFLAISFIFATTSLFLSANIYYLSFAFLTFTFAIICLLKKPETASSAPVLNF